MNAIETRDLTHRYGREVAVSALALQIPAGAIFGFFGPNGAGKTTTLRLVLGLLRLQQGEVTVLGRPLGRARLPILRRVGSCIESPSLYADLTVAENLEVWRIAFDCPRPRIVQVLQIVGLERARTKRARQLSLGMKQRLGLAIALLHEPELLLLDEPANGLDPEGILEMRDLLRTLNREHGITIVVSSHVLAEVERLVTHVGVIRRGELRFQGTLSDLVGRRSDAMQISVRTGDDRRALDLLPDARLEDSGLIVPSRSSADTAEIVRRLVLAGIDVHAVTPVESDLERVFLDLVAADA